MNDAALDLEILELTELLRQSPELLELRLALETKGLNIATTRLVSISEDEDLNEFGVVVSSHDEIFEYMRNNNAGPSPDLLKWKQLVPSQAVMALYRTLPAALTKR